MAWQHLLADITGTVDQALLLRHEYLGTEHRILCHQITGRVPLSDGARQSLAEIGQKLGKQAQQDIARIVQPDTILGWHRKRVASCHPDSLASTTGREHTALPFNRASMMLGSSEDPCHRDRQI